MTEQKHDKDVDKIINDFFEWCCDTNYEIDGNFNQNTIMNDPKCASFINLIFQDVIDKKFAIDKIGEKLPEMDIARGSFVSFIIGYFGELGISTKSSTMALLDKFIDNVELCARFKGYAKALKSETLTCHMFPKLFRAMIFMGFVSKATASRIQADREYRDYLRSRGEQFLNNIKMLTENFPSIAPIPSILTKDEE